MNMPTSFKSIFIAFIVLTFISCSEEVYNIYDVNAIEVSPVNADKNKAKTDAQYVSIVYTNLFQIPIGPNTLLETLDAIRSIGDKQISYDILVSKYMAANPIIPSKEEMFADPEIFIRNTYQRFYTRQPTEAELTWMLNYVQSNPDLTPDVFYFSFATSNEHYHY